MTDSTNKTHRGRKGVIAAAVLIILVGAGVMLYPHMTDLRYLWSQWRLTSTAQAAPDTGSDGTGGIALPDGAVAWMQIPAIDFEAYVLEGTDKSVLAKAPGHYAGTPLPGEEGNVAIAGHRTMNGHPFQNLDQLEPGDEILTGTAEGTAVYRVVDILVVKPTNTDVIAQSDEDLLTLTTCHPEGKASKRLVVVAELTK